MSLKNRLARLAGSYVFWAAALVLATVFVLGFPALYFSAADRAAFSSLQRDRVERPDLAEMTYTDATPTQVLWMLANGQYTASADDRPEDPKQEVWYCLNRFARTGDQDGMGFGSYFYGRLVETWDDWRLEDFSTLVGVGAYDGTICTSTLYEAVLVNWRDGSYFCFRFDAQTLMLYSFVAVDSLWEVVDPIDAADELDPAFYLFLTQYLKLNPDNCRVDGGYDAALGSQPVTEIGEAQGPKNVFTETGMDFYGYFYGTDWFAYLALSGDNFGPAQLLWDGTQLQANWFSW